MNKRQADERGRVLTFHLFYQRDAEPLGFETAGAPEGLIGREIATYLILAKDAEMHLKGDAGDLHTPGFGVQ